MVITHDVDEAIYMCDRVCMMTNGPRARVGEVLNIPFERPRTRSEVLEHSTYYELRARLVGFLEHQERRDDRPKVKNYAEAVSKRHEVDDLDTPSETPTAHAEQQSCEADSVPAGSEVA